MKKLMNGVFGILLVVAVGAMPLHGMKSKDKKVKVEWLQGDSQSEMNEIIPLKYDEESDREFEEFTQKFAPPLKIQETIESHKDINIGLVRGKDESSNVYAHGRDLTRFFNAERMWNCIKDNNFTTLAVAKTWVYKVNGQWRVYAEYIPSGEGKDLTLEETQELVEFVEQTGFQDWAAYDNVIFDKRNGKMTFVDTEADSFSRYELEGFPEDCKLQYAKCLYSIYGAMDDNGKKWFDEHIDYLEHNPEGRVVIKPLPWSVQFDDPDFDFHKMEDKLREDSIYIRHPILSESWGGDS